MGTLSPVNSTLSRDGVLDGFRMVLAVMVLALHAGSAAVGEGAYLTVNGLFRIAVPVFFIMNGYYFSKACTNRATFLSWLKKAAGIYVFWMVLYLPCYLHPQTLSGAAAWAMLFATMVMGYHHLWYMAGLICGGILLYCLREQASIRLAAMATILFVMGVCLQYCRVYHNFSSSLLQNIVALNWTSRNFLFFGFPFLCAGFLIARHAWRPQGLRAMASVAAAALLLVVLESHANYLLQGATKKSFDMLFALALAAPACFMVALHAPSRGSMLVSRMSSAVYFIHPACLALAVYWGWQDWGSLTLAGLFLSLLASLPLMQLARRWRYIL
jgi:hypothetical protein